jgi:uncharacterized membrane protein YtjA (UPF0391 family)
MGSRLTWFALVALREESIASEKSHACMAQLLWTVIVVIFVIWLIGWLAFHLIVWSWHILLVVVVILLIINLVRRA